ncbi:hypothetical protein CHLRE_13g592300v5 [Chlamydomonas reinhardtii]|uniref:DUS-like FMN-binding domain-containing protein n=1 Tax=Chlamydomonas reinhardtii TaxID=3055 RepID=A0A2K3D165_CHLRE|nr:uncharacterized protein CHLRE_13g592300v5 [Chlamydomonas reinhardtii]PNW74273.1 hypothetical protein CHLRE_13g592300v5 [Chlamydomonas reinhardtii]
MEYRDKLVLAPMVRVGMQPMRLLAASYGADIVYSEELVAQRVIASTRVVNEELQSIDFLDRGGEHGRVMFRTTAEERPRLVFQLGAADAVLALQAAQVVAGDVAEVGLNMGCPKAFSLQGGMGAALLRKPEIAEDIMKTLHRNLNIPVSCKIRLLDTDQDTVELARRLAACGINALAVHGRTTQQRPRDPAHWDPIRLVVDALAPDGVPVVANGDVFTWEDAQRVKRETGCAAAMIARAAMWNASVFRPQGFLPLDEVQREFVRLALKWENALPNTKYCLKEMADTPPSFLGRCGGVRTLVGHEANTAITRAKDAASLCALLGLSAASPHEDLGDGAPGSFSGITNGGAKAKAPKQPKAPRPMKHARQPKNGQKPEAVEEPGAAATGCHAPEESAGGEGLKRKRDECGDAEPVAQVRRHADALPQGA